MGPRRMLGRDLDAHQFGSAAGILDQFGSVFRCVLSHDQGQLALGCHLDGSAINALHILRGLRTSTADSNKKLEAAHDLGGSLVVANKMVSH